MRRNNIGPWRAAANAGFALAVLALAGFGLYQVAGRHWRVQPMFRVRAEFPTIGGLEAGHRVRLQGIDAGVVERVIAPAEPGRPVELVLRIDERLRPLVRGDTVARIVSEGLVGAKVVELTPGRPDAAPVAEMGRIASERPIEMADVLKRASASMDRLETLARSAEQGLTEVNAIAGSIRRGEGSLGKLVQDETLYRELMAVSRRGEKSLAALEENLECSSRPGRSRGISTAGPTSTASVCSSSPARSATAAPSSLTRSSSPGRYSRRSAGPARRGRPMVQAGQSPRLAGRHRRVHRRRPRPGARRDPHAGAG